MIDDEVPELTDETMKRLQEMWRTVKATPRPADYDYVQDNRHFYPMGPVPEGWERRPHCSRNIPHNEGDWDQNIEMNADHYPEYVRTLMLDTLATARKELADDE